MEQLDLLDREVYQSVVAAIPDPFFIFDEDGYYVQIIGGADRRKYHDGQHLIGKRIHDVIATNLADSFVREIRRAINAEKVTTYVYRLAASDIVGSENMQGPEGQQWFEANISPISPIAGRPRMVVWVAFNITEQRRILAEKQTLIDELRSASREINTLRKILPICSYCKKIRDDKGYWNQVEAYIHRHTGAEFSHSICTDCAQKYFPGYTSPEHIVE